MGNSASAPLKDSLQQAAERLRNQMGTQYPTLFAVVTSPLSGDPAESGIIRVLFRDTPYFRHPEMPAIFEGFPVRTEIIGAISAQTPDPDLDGMRAFTAEIRKNPELARDFLHQLKISMQQ